METWQSSFFCRYLADPGQIPELKIFIWYGKIEKNIMFFFLPFIDRGGFARNGKKNGNARTKSYKHGGFERYGKLQAGIYSVYGGQ